MLSIEVQPRSQGRHARTAAAPDRLPQSRAAINERKARRAMRARELALMGFSALQVAARLKVSDVTALKYAREYGFSYAKKPESDLRKAIRAAYAEGGGGPRAAALATGAKYDTVKMMASKMGLSQQSDHFRFYRGFAVPDGRKPEYRELRQAKLTPTEAGQIMGLIPRDITK